MNDTNKRFEGYRAMSEPAAYAGLVAGILCEITAQCWTPEEKLQHIFHDIKVFNEVCPMQGITDMLERNKDKFK